MHWGYIPPGDHVLSATLDTCWGGERAEAQDSLTAWQSGLSPFSLIDFETFFLHPKGLPSSIYQVASHSFGAARVGPESNKVRICRSNVRFSWVHAGSRLLWQESFETGQQSFIFHSSLFPWAFGSVWSTLTLVLGILKVELVLLSALAILCDLFGIVKLPFPRLRPSNYIERSLWNTWVNVCFSKSQDLQRGICRCKINSRSSIACALRLWKVLPCCICGMTLLPPSTHEQLEVPNSILLRALEAELQIGGGKMRQQANPVLYTSEDVCLAMWKFRHQLSLFCKIIYPVPCPWCNHLVNILRFQIYVNSHK